MNKQQRIIDNLQDEIDDLRESYFELQYELKYTLNERIRRSIEKQMRKNLFRKAQIEIAIDQAWHAGYPDCYGNDPLQHPIGN